jgi:hypothetical protein
MLQRTLPAGFIAPQKSRNCRPAANGLHEIKHDRHLDAEREAATAVPLWATDI